MIVYNKYSSLYAFDISLCHRYLRKFCQTIFAVVDLQGEVFFGDVGFENRHSVVLREVREKGIKGSGLIISGGLVCFTIQIPTKTTWGSQSALFYYL